jgi:hypothetical protein
LQRIEKVLKNKSCTAVQLFQAIFKRKIAPSEYGLALAEAVGHVNYFKIRGKLKFKESNEGAILYSLK